mmetsp:Transcript_11879/g.21711  ORF Transcript_11879/g.21711 Transcript_11879/m.21711 type:complete len:304 (+) Transcript_11879:60-971(+)
MALPPSIRLCTILLLAHSINPVISASVDAHGKLSACVVGPDGECIETVGGKVMRRDARKTDDVPSSLMDEGQDPQDPPGSSASNCNNVDAFGFNKKSSYSFGEDSFQTFDVGETVADCAASCNGMQECDGFTFTLVTDKHGVCKVYEQDGTQKGHLDENRVASYRKCEKPTTTEYVPPNFTVDIDGTDSLATTTAEGHLGANELVGEAGGAGKLEGCSTQDIDGYDTRKSYRYTGSSISVHYHETPNSCAGLCSSSPTCAGFTVRDGWSGSTSECHLYGAASVSGGEYGTESETSYRKCGQAK